MSPTSKVLVITSCTKRKRKGRGKAKEIYMGPIKNIFLIADELNAKCFILSAKYGIISCEDEIESYDKYLGNMSKEEVKELMDKIKRRCEDLKGPWELVITNMSSKYAAILECPIVAKNALIIGTPPKGLRAEEARVYKFKTVGEWYSLMKRIKELLGEL
ncbi:hypothetical protein IPA_08230 [Ignicoccus pacificus DSM 13166]|uniref:DUF6884 domain-containing protein n=1 Tax=Ignicoccus pacificus DSM 13166 TaxID=940294 RepID=A0A977PKF1_9CREN|nr:hypothetical protein IPA_08230 [Ignicoccus pacificus DSM 13166]